MHNDKVKVTSTKPLVTVPSGNKPSVARPDVLICFLNKVSVTDTQCREIFRKAATTGIPVIMAREKAFSKAALEAILLHNNQLESDLDLSLKDKETIADEGHSAVDFIGFATEEKETREFSSADRYRYCNHGKITCTSNDDGCSLSSVITRGFNNAVVCSIDEIDNGIGRLLVELARYINDIKPHVSNTGNINTDEHRSTLPPVNKQKQLVQPKRGTKMSQKRNNGFHFAKHSVNGSLKLPPILPSKPREPIVTDADKTVMGMKAKNRRQRPSVHGTNGNVVDYVTEYNKSLILPPLDNRPLSASNVVLCDNNKFATFSHSTDRYMEQSQQYSKKRNLSIAVSSVPPLRSVSANDLGKNEHIYSPSPPLFDSGTKTLYLVMKKYNSVPELLVWPPDGGEETPMSITDFLSEGSDTDDDGISCSVDIDWEDITSNSTTPDMY